MEGASKPVIEINDATVGFGGPPVLENISLAVYESETVIILGESGSGKSTLLALALGLLDPVSGNVTVLGEPVSGRRERDLYPVRQKIGMVFQHGALFDSETVFNNIGFRMLQRPDLDSEQVAVEVAEKLRFVDLEGYDQRLPSELSGGQRRRVAIARAMVGNPQVMLYDEPTTGLDPITAKKVLEVLKKIKSELGTTSIVVTHELHYAYYVADRVVLLRNGGIYFDGPSAEFRNSDDPYILEFRSMEA